MHLCITCAELISTRHKQNILATLTLDKTETYTLVLQTLTNL